ncbi:MAG: oligoribonuclease [Amphritea sp.]
MNAQQQPPMNHLVWIDTETGGLTGPASHFDGPRRMGQQYYPLFEIAVIVTDLELNQIGQPLRLVIFQPERMIERCDEYAANMHINSGLMKEVRESGISLQNAEHRILYHLESLGVQPYDRKAKTGAVMAGNSIAFDRAFVDCQMPALGALLHYRLFDVSALALAFRFWNPSIANEVQKEYKHTALDDICESISEAKTYRPFMADLLAEQISN